MMLAYYSVAAREEFWTEHWGGHSVEEMLAVARVSPLTPLITDALPAHGLVLEAGCGLGQYVLLLRASGWQAMGVDWSVDALAACRRVAPAPLAAMQLQALALRDGVAAAYISLGVVEHDPAGPDAILAEARRVLAPGGVIVVSVPYVNGVRRLAAPWLRRQGRRIAEGGGSFYQYAFSRGELMGALRRHGFTPRAAHPYDPVRILRGALRSLGLRGQPRRGPIDLHGGPRPGPPSPPIDLHGGLDGPPSPHALGSAPAEPERSSVLRGGRSRVRDVVRAVFYTAPVLRLLGHMLLVVAVKR
ncbi:MAG TPA: class I SAM-dependent methyltransferase [Candidatus Limnocylindria bacterium]|nr:class I SAM-dependent methyltransferase [Candidatus Limnocylindria bacterium]